ncbi:gamma-glutamyltransferase family protein [Saccharolobus shibatae]|uniref:Gamma-glutamyltranspeptidase Glutathione hydrolase n=1 Tax=Saccharolobus shibatae TaxID=2286 RepID=A0A8F5BSW7_9CREN|nr:gamma-glutamyltransferase family protein [Saccharolobus shibatae]QXJ30714.1 Gamma-glutamyltranspeptidase Glutathione hydrolase [Saccharolobus shibatae]QXJ33742.1 Gamma-glutamyltranspeptidase Glutathione hydrolase [Saccharolobus shibatae]
MPSAVGKKVVTTQNYIASYVGAKVLEEGGNAFDAAIAISATLSVVIPHTSGLGGDGFLLAKTPEGLIAYNASGWAPKELKVEKIDNDRSPLTVVVPGLVDLWEFIYENYASKSLNELLNPAISLATNGFMVGRGLHHAIVSSFKLSDDWNRVYGNKRFGDEIRLKGIARVLKEIAKDPRSFYDGKIAEELTNGLRERGVPMSYEDFSEFRGEVISPVKMKYKDFTLYELPPNTQGITTLELLKMVEITELNKLPFNDVRRINDHVRLSALAYADRNKYIADPKFVNVPIEMLLSEKYIANKIAEYGFEVKVDVTGDTTFFAVSDGENEIGFIQSLFYPFGSGIVVNDIPFNNRGAGFSEGNNKPEPRKRPLHTLSILMAEKEDERVFIGCAGGDLRPQIHAEVFEYYADYNMEIDEAVQAPRFMYLGNKVVAEKRLGVPATQTDYYSPEVGIVQALKYKKGRYIGVADIRSEGVALPVK